MLTRSRRACAVTAALLWLVGVEALPDAHLADHHDDHTHTADGTIVADHHHDVDGHDAPDGFLDHTGRLAIDHDSPSHTAAGLAHHAQALHQPPPPLVARFVPRTLAWQRSAITAPLSSIPAVSPTARGPPARSRPV